MRQKSKTIAIIRISRVDPEQRIEGQSSDTPEKGDVRIPLKDGGRHVQKLPEFGFQLLQFLLPCKFWKCQELEQLHQDERVISFGLTFTDASFHVEDLIHGGFESRHFLAPLGFLLGLLLRGRLHLQSPVHFSLNFSNVAEIKKFNNEKEQEVSAVSDSIRQERSTAGARARSGGTLFERKSHAGISNPPWSYVSSSSPP